METTQDYLHLMQRDYPEELKPGGFVEATKARFQYLDRHPNEWSREAEWVREAWRKNPEEAVLKYSYEFLRSFA